MANKCCRRCGICLSYIPVLPFILWMFGFVCLICWVTVYHIGLSDYEKFVQNMSSYLNIYSENYTSEQFGYVKLTVYCLLFFSAVWITFYLIMAGFAKNNVVQNAFGTKNKNICGRIANIWLGTFTFILLLMWLCTLFFNGVVYLLIIAGEPLIRNGTLGQGGSKFLNTPSGIELMKTANNLELIHAIALASVGGFFFTMIFILMGVAAQYVQIKTAINSGYSLPNEGERTKL